MKTQKILGVVVALSLGLSTVGLSQGGGSAAADPVVAAQPTIAIENPPPGQVHVRGRESILFGGSAAPSAQLTGARVLSLSPDGEIVRSYIPPGLTLSDGAFSGQTTYGGPGSFEAHDGRLVLEVTMILDGETQVIRSNGLRIDLVPPYVLGSSLVAPDLVRVEFSEPVHVNDPIDEVDLVIDWTVDGQTPLDVIKDPDDGSIRYLKVALTEGTGFDQDDTPEVRLITSLPATHMQHVYLDRAIWFLEPERNRTTIAVDRIAPEAPVLETIAGQANDGVEEIFSNDHKPEFVLTGIRPGHVGQVYLESNKKAGFQPDDDALLGEAEADENGRAVVKPDEPLDDDSYDVYGVARDRASCQPAEPASAECPNYSKSAPGFYTLDTIAPVALFAQTTMRQGTSDAIIKVRFSEDILPNEGNPAEWSVGGVPPESVEGVGNERILDIANVAPGGTPVVWTPPAEGAYADKAGNPLVPFELNATDGIPPLVFLAPDLVDTKGTLYARNGNCQTAVENRVCFVITGTAERATHLLVHGAPDAQDEVILDEGNVYSGPFLLEVDLVANERNENVQIEPIRLDLDQPNPTEVRGPMARVRTIVHDNQKPLVTVGALGRPLHDGSVGYKGMDQATISWTASDPNLVPGPIKIELSTDGGQTWETIADGKTNTDGDAGTLGWSVPALNTEKAKIRVTATDQVEFEESAVSNEFVIDSKLPSFIPQTQLDETGNPTRVLLTFSEPVVFDDELGNQWNQWQIQEEGQPPVPAQSAVPVDTTLGDDGITMIKKLMLTTGFVDGAPSPVQQHLDRNGTPTVTYVVPEGGEDLANQFRDRANNLLASNTGKAQDGIDPLPPDNLAARDLIRERTEPLRGEAEADSRLDVMVRRISPGATFSDAVTVKEPTSITGDPTGLFTVQVGLASNRVNSYEVWVQDKAGNTSPAVTLGIENDRKAPRVKVLKPKKFSKSGKRYLRLKWRTTERNKKNVDIHFRLKGKYTSKRLRNMVRSTPDDGVYRWRIPRKFWGKKFKVAILARDQVGNRGVRGYRWIKL